VKAGWRVVPLGEIAAISYGYTAKASSEPVGPKFLRITDIQDNSVNWDTVPFCSIGATEHRRHVIKDGDIVFARTGATTGKSFLIKNPPDAVCASYLIKLRVEGRQDILPEYLSAFFQTTQYWKAIEFGTEGAAQGGFNASKLAGMPIPLPPLDEQKRIVAVLDEAFDGLSRARANAEANLIDARTLFSQTVTRVLDRMTSTSERVRLEEVTQKITKGSSPKWQGVSYVEEPGVLFVTSENVKANRIDLTARKYVEERFNEIESRSVLERGDVLANIVGASIGRAAVYNENDGANINQAVCLIRCDPKFLLSEYLSFLLNSDALLSVLHEGKTDMARANLSLAFFRDLPIPLPSIENQREVVEALRAISEEVARLDKCIVERCSSIDTLRQSLLQKAFSGELT